MSPMRQKLSRGRDADDALVRQARRSCCHSACGVVVLGVDRDQQPVLGQPELLGDQVPGEFDRALLEIVAEGEIPQHLEEGVVARGIARHCRGRCACRRPARISATWSRARVGALLRAGEDVLELHHAGIGEHQGRIVARHQRRRRHDLMAVAREIVEEGRSDLVDAAHVMGPFSGHVAPGYALVAAL